MAKPSKFDKYKNRKLSREELIEVVEAIICVEGTEKEQDDLCLIFEANTPNPDAINLIFWPEPLDKVVTAEEVVEEALNYVSPLTSDPQLNAEYGKYLDHQLSRAELIELAEILLDADRSEQEKKLLGHVFLMSVPHPYPDILFTQAIKKNQKSATAVVDKALAFKWDVAT